MGEITINPTHNVHKKYRTMNLVNPYLFAPPVDLSTNTEIGGVASTISTPALLATKLGIDVSRITNFSIVGSDIQCRIIGTYSTGNYFNNDGRNSATTYYLDNDGLITDVGYVRGYPVLKQFYHPNAMSMSIGYYGRQCAILNIAYFPKLTSCSNAEFYGFMEGKQAGLKCRIYIPLCTTMATPTTGQVFGGGGANSDTTIYCHPSLATNNGGAPDNDIAYAISQGATVVYVTNFTAPLTPTLTSIGTIYNTAVQLVDAGVSANAIDYFEVAVNGVPYGNVNVGSYITGLTPNTFYSITLKAVDIFYNKSVVSNSISVSTIAGAFPNYGLVSYYKLDSNSNDSYGSNNGTDTSVSYVSGKITNAANFNGSSSLISVADSNSLSFNNATNDLPFSISYWIKASNTQFSIINKSGASTREYECEYGSGKLLFRLISNGNVANRLDQNYTMTINTGNWIHIVHTYNGLGSGGMKTYVNGSLVTSTNTVTGTYTKMSNTINPLVFGTLTPFAGYALNGQLDEISIYNRALTQADIDLLYNSGNGITL